MAMSNLIPNAIIASTVANNVGSYGRDMVQNGLRFMYSYKSTHFFLFYHKRFHTFSNFDSNKTDDTSVLRRNQPN